MPQIFTVEEANQALEVIRPLMTQILEIRKTILARQPEMWPVIEKAVGNGGNKAASMVATDFNRLEDLVGKIQATGALIKDVNSGLVDFLALREGREVYLCWRYDEGEIQYWHDIDAGFAGRTPI
jgi:hypothetical protein